MYAVVHNEIGELQPILEFLRTRRSIFPQLQWRLLRGLEKELKEARQNGITWRMVWQALDADGFTGSYAGFCRAANLAIGNVAKPAKPRKTTAREGEEQEQSHQEKSIAQLRREAAARREAAEKSIAEDLERAKAMKEPRKRFTLAGL